MLGVTGVIASLWAIERSATQVFGSDIKGASLENAVIHLLKFITTSFLRYDLSRSIVLGESQYRKS